MALQVKSTLVQGYHYPKLWAWKLCYRPLIEYPAYEKIKYKVSHYDPRQNFLGGLPVETSGLICWEGLTKSKKHYQYGVQVDQGFMSTIEVSNNQFPIKPDGNVIESQKDMEKFLVKHFESFDLLPVVYQALFPKFDSLEQNEKPNLEKVEYFIRPVMIMTKKDLSQCFFMKLTSKKPADEWIQKGYVIPLKSNQFEYGCRNPCYLIPLQLIGVDKDVSQQLYLPIDGYVQNIQESRLDKTNFYVIKKNQIEIVKSQIIKAASCSAYNPLPETPGFDWLFDNDESEPTLDEVLKSIDNHCIMGEIELHKCLGHDSDDDTDDDNNNDDNNNDDDNNNNNDDDNNNNDDNNNKDINNNNSNKDINNNNNNKDINNTNK